MRAAIVIPARYASSRLPGKPLLRETGKYLIEHVYEQALKVQSAEAVIVATDDLRIFNAVQGFGGRAIMTRDDHPSGTDRIAEVAEHLNADVIVNLQGDEPQFRPEDLDALTKLMSQAGTDVATLATPILDATTYRNPNVVKVVCDDHGRALYFSRSPIPYYRDSEPSYSSKNPVLQHLGVYAYRREMLLKLAKLPPHPLEQAEKLEQLRVLGNGGTIRVAITNHSAKGVDTQEDYATFVRTCRAA